MFKKIWNNKKWTLYLYYNGIYVKRVKINDMNDIKPMSISIWGHKELFGRIKINTVIKPVRLLLTDEKNKKTHWGITFEKGIDV